MKKIKEEEKIKTIKPIKTTETNNDHSLLKDVMSIIKVASAINNNFSTSSETKNISVKDMFATEMKNTKFLIVGRSGVGKSSIAKAVGERLGLNVITSYTTRPRRKNEKETDHHFITLSSAQKFEGQKAAKTKIGEYEYFVTFDELERGDIYVIDPVGIASLKLNTGNEYDLVEIYLRAPFKVVQERIKEKRDKLMFNKRRETEDEMFKLYEKEQTFHYNVINDGTFDEAVDKVSGCIQGYLLEKSVKKEIEEENKRRK